RGAYRDAESTLDQLASATGGTITVQDVLSLLGTVEDEVLFRLCDLVVDRDTAGALTFLEELAEQGQDLGRLVVDLLEHLRHLMLVQHMGEVPDTLPVTEETRERLRAQANQLGEATLIRLAGVPARLRAGARAQGAPPAPPPRARAGEGEGPGRRPVGEFPLLPLGAVGDARARLRKPCLGDSP